MLIIESGMSFHNMRVYGNPQYSPISDVFDAWLTKAIESSAQERFRLLAARDQGPGAAADDEGRKVFSDRLVETTLPAFTFG